MFLIIKTLTSFIPTKKSFYLAHFLSCKCLFWRKANLLVILFPDMKPKYTEFSYIHF